MRSCWSPQSALLLEPPLSFASAALIRTLLAAQPELTLIYAGDRMWPAVRHAQQVIVKRLTREGLQPGRLVVAESGGIPELLRIDVLDGETFILRGDADPGFSLSGNERSILGCVDGAARRPGSARRALHRVILDVAESLRHGPDDEQDGAESVRIKYDSQAVYYTLGLDQSLPESLHHRLKRLLPPGGKILVAGSGVGTECFALAEAGWRVSGIDFAPEMVSRARKEALKRGADIEFHLSDLRNHVQEPRSVDGILFTWDVYSFIPLPDQRKALLERMKGWLRPGGAMFLSARTTAGLYEQVILTLARLGPARSVEGLWGASHSRWIDRDGRMRRSFLRRFTSGRLEKEVSAAGLILGDLESGHFLVSARESGD